MSFQDTTAVGRTGVEWRRVESLLVLVGLLGFVTLPIGITEIYGGLPAHPLFVHVPVILIPTTVGAGLVFMFRTDWLSRYGAALALVSIFAMSSVFLTLNAGGALEEALHLHGEAAHLIDEHSQAANILAIVYVAFTALLIVTFASLRVSAGRPTGLAVLDLALGSRAVLNGLRALVVVLALVAAFMTYRTGDLGAKAVWAGRIQAAEGRSGGG